MSPGNTSEHAARQLILVRHSVPAIVPGTPARAWHLSPEGRQRCVPLAARLASCAPRAIISSDEAKAVETAAFVGDALGLSVSRAPGLHEHERHHTGWLHADAFQAAVAVFFARPDELVLGEETATAANARFLAAVERVLAEHPLGTVAVVSHGTVITLLVAWANGLDPLAFWRGLGQPAYVVLQLPGYRLLETAAQVV